MNGLANIRFHVTKSELKSAVPAAISTRAKYNVQVVTLAIARNSST